MSSQKIITFANQKGGVGKSTVATLVAQTLSMQKLKTLLISVDSQSNSPAWLGVKNEAGKEFADLIIQDLEIKDVVHKVNDNLDVIPNSIRGNTAELILAGMSNREMLLKRKLKKVSYDIVILDVAPSIALGTANAILSSTHIFLVSLLEEASLRGLATISAKINELKENELPVADISGIILNRTNISMRSGHGKMCKQMLERNYNGLILQNYLMQNIDLTNACAKGEFLQDYNPQSKAVKNVESLTNEILERL